MKLVALIVAVVTLQGCASIVNGGRQDVAFLSEPAGAEYVVRNADGIVAQGVTPSSERLSAGAGYFRKAGYTVTYSKDGYGEQSRTLAPEVSGWYWVGAVFSVASALIVDPLTGGMWKLPEQSSAKLAPTHN